MGSAYTAKGDDGDWHCQNCYGRESDVSLDWHKAEMARAVKVVDAVRRWVNDGSVRDQEVRAALSEFDRATEETQ